MQWILFQVEVDVSGPLLGRGFLLFVPLRDHVTYRRPLNLNGLGGVSTVFLYVVYTFYSKFPVLPLKEKTFSACVFLKLSLTFLFHLLQGLDIKLYFFFTGRSVSRTKEIIVLVSCFQL